MAQADINTRQLDDNKIPTLRALRGIFFAEGGHPDRIRQLFSLSLVSAIFNGFYASMMFYLALDMLPLSIAGFAYAFMLLLSLWIFRGQHMGRNLRITRISNRTLRKQAVMVALVIMPWSIILLLVTLYVPPEKQFIPVMTVFAYIVGGSIVLSVIPMLVAVYNFVVLMPSVVVNLMHFESNTTLLVLAMVSIGCIMLFFSMYYSMLLSEKERRDEQRAEDMIRLGEARDAISHIAHTDPITGLMNRRAFNSALDELLSTLKPDATQSHALFLVDLDHFKHINDAYGHEMGDLYLKKVGERLIGAAGETLSVARLGGDEFAILSHKAMCIGEIHEMGQSLVDAMAAPYTLEDLVLKGGCSIGAALTPLHSVHASDLLTFADQALREAKMTKRGSLIVFSADNKEQHLLRRMQALALESAVKAGEIEVAYQPQIDLRSGKLEGFEALARWTMPGAGPVSPPLFFALAEDHGFVLDLCEALWQTISDTVSGWRQAGLDFGSLSVNIHPSQLHHTHRFITALEKLAEAAGGRDRIILEITENCVIGRGMEDVPALLADLSLRGYRISLDDFGTGFASLTHIKELPIHEIKIDRHFIIDLDTNAHDRAIVRAVYDIARPRAIKVVAEGAETKAQIEALAEIGGSIVQGFYYSKPLPASEAQAFIATRQPMPVVLAALHEKAQKRLPGSVKAG